MSLHEHIDIVSHVFQTVLHIARIHVLDLDSVVGHF